VRSGKRAPGVSQLLAPGEPEWRRHQSAAGQVHLAPAVADMLIRMARDLRVSAMPLARDDQPATREGGHAQA
jgi:hypothetical protein